MRTPSRSTLTTPARPVPTLATTRPPRSKNGDPPAGKAFNQHKMIVKKKERLAVYAYLFKEGVCVAPKDFRDGIAHQDIEGVSNLVVINLMKSLTSRSAT